MLITSSHLYFYTARPFHNWLVSPNQLTVKGYSFDSTEKAFMYLKADFFGDYEVAKLIYQESDPAKAKALGRLVNGYDDAVWSCVREGMMTYVNLLKYRGNKEWAYQLLDTGDRTIVEASPIDKVWGVGLAEKDPLILDERNWRGLNLLGKSLMTVREMLRREKESAKILEKTA